MRSARAQGPAAEREESAARRAAGLLVAIREEAGGWCASAEACPCHPCFTPTRADGRWEVLGTAGGWVGWGLEVLKAILCLENGGQSAFSPPDPGPAFSTPTSHHRIPTGLLHPRRLAALGCDLTCLGRRWELKRGPRMGEDRDQASPARPPG